MFGLNMIVNKGKTVFVGDTSVHEYPSSEQLAEIAISSARVVRCLDLILKLLLYLILHLDNHLQVELNILKMQLNILKEKNVDFEFDGDMQPDVALK